MESRRGPRFVIDPKIRQVGFITPGSEPARDTPPTTTTAVAAVPLPEAAGHHSLSPIVIPLPRPLESPLKLSPLPVPSSPAHKLLPIDAPIPLGSYAFPVLGSSLSSKNENNSNSGYISVPLEGLGHFSSSYITRLNSDRERLSVKGDDHCDISRPIGSSVAAASISSGMKSLLKQQGGNPISLPTARSLPHAVHVLPTSGMDVHAKSLKERTSNAERRANQEADREAKRSARGSGGSKAGGGDGQHGKLQKDGKAKKVQLQKKDIVSEKKPSSVIEKKGGNKGYDKENKKEIPAPLMQVDDNRRVAKAKRFSFEEQTETKNQVELFRHLPQLVHRTHLSSLESKFFQDDPMHPHPAVYQVGLQYLTGGIVGGNARCIAMLLAFQEIIKDYTTPKEKTLIRDLTAKINNHVSFLITCSLLSVSMGNAIRFLKTCIAKLSVTISEAEAKTFLIGEIDRFIQEKITFADKEITKCAVSKIRDGDVILTYASSCVVEMILLHALELGRKFRVIIVDSRPKLEGKKLLRRLLGRGISCTYTHINAISYIMQEVTLVFLGAASVLSNGTVYSRVGTACVAMVAHAFHVPVLICCETYKFHERVQLDSVCLNELGDPDDLVTVPRRNDLCELEGWADNKHLQLLNLTYDATPSDYVSMIITELGMVPPTSVPVILREYRKEPML